MTQQSTEKIPPTPELAKYQTDPGSGLLLLQEKGKMSHCQERKNTLLINIKEPQWSD